jgi:ribosomal protein L24
VKRIKKGDQVRVKTEYKKINGKIGTVVNAEKWECDVRIDGHTYLLHKDLLTVMPKSS